MDMGPDDKIDLVLTWVDDSLPGYREHLNQYAKTGSDRDASRTRDTIETLRYSLRSIDAFAPWINRVYLLTCRPQVPGWLNPDHPKLRLVHHDQIMDHGILPTFNSFTIVSHLHLLPDLSRTFIYMEDDMMFLSPVHPGDFHAPDNRTLVFEEKHIAPAAETIDSATPASGWNLALAQSNHHLDLAYGKRVRHQVNHVPLLIDRENWATMCRTFSAAIDVTRSSRFRSRGNIAPEYLYPQYLVEEGLAQTVGEEASRTVSGYVPLENVWLVTLWALAGIRRRHPKWLTMNDNLGERPSRICMWLARRFLQSSFPRPSSFERA